MTENKLQNDLIEFSTGKVYICRISIHLLSIHQTSIHLVLPYRESVTVGAETQNLQCLYVCANFRISVATWTDAQ